VVEAVRFVLMLVVRLIAKWDITDVASKVLEVVFATEALDI
jgi:hypothetical protein